MNETFLKGSIAGPLFRFAVPIAFTLILEQAVNMTDVLVLGQFVGTSGMAAVGNDMPVLALLISLMVGLSLGTNVTVAQYIGGKKFEQARMAEHTGILFSLLVGIAFAVLGEVLTEPMLGILGVPAAVMGDAELYLRIFFLGLPFVALYNFEAATFRALGDGKTPLYSLVAAVLTNLVLDLAAGFLGLGLAGIVGATIISYVVDSMVLWFMLMRRTDFLQLRVRDLKLHREELREIIHIGLPAGIQGMVFSISNLVIQSAINSLGPEVMAASSAALTIEINVYSFVNAFGQATTTFVGQNFGAMQIRRCFEVTKKALMVEFSFTLLLSAVCCLLADPLMGLFTTNPDVVYYGTIRLYLVAGLQCINGVIEVLSGALRGYGYSLPPALVALVAICGTRIIWIMTVFAAWPTYFTIMVGYPVSWLVTGIILAVVYRKMRQQIFRNYAGRMREELKRADVALN